MQQTGNARNRALVRDTGLFTISSFGSKILVFLLTPLYTSILSTSDYGIADLITTTINFVYPVLTIAIADATLRYALDASNDKNEIFSVSTLFTVLSVIFLLPFKSVVAHIDQTLVDYWFPFVAIYALFNIHNYFSNLVKGLGKTKLFAIQGIVQTVTIILSNIIFLVFCGMKLEGYLLSLMIGHVVPSVLMFFGAKLYKYIIPFRISKPLLLDMLKYSIPMIPTMLAWAINTSIDKYMIIGWYGLEESGIYSVAHKIPTVITTVFAVFLQAWQISAVTNHGSKDESEYYSTVYKGLDFISVCGSLFVIIITKPLAAFLFAKDFYVAWMYVPMLIIASMFSSHAGFLAAAYRAAKKTASLFVSVLIGAVLNIVLNYFLLTSMGVMGAAVATAVSFFAVWFVRIILIQKIVAVKIKIIPTVLTYACLLAATIITMLDVAYAYILCIVLLALVILINRFVFVSFINTFINIGRKLLKKN